MTPSELEARQKRQDSFWTGPRFIALLSVALGVALVVIFTIASLKSGDFTWRPFAHEPAHEVGPSDW